VALQRPTATVTVAGSALSAQEAALARVRVRLGVGGAHDAAYAALGPRSPLHDVDAGADFVLELGYGAGAQAVLTGAVAAVRRHPWGTVIEALAATHALSRVRVAQSYLRQWAGDVVRDLLGRAGVQPGEVDAPTVLAAFHVDERQSAWRHLQRLARLVGCETSCSADGALHFRAARSGPADHALRRGAELARWSVGPDRLDEGDVAVVPFGAASEEGAEKWHIVLREPDQGAPTTPTLVPGAARDQDTASALEAGLRSAARRRARAGEVWVTGDAAVRAGDLVSLDDVPGDDGSPWRVREVLHLLDGAIGFCTALSLEAAA